MHDFWASTSSALSVNSSDPSLMAASRGSYLKFGFRTSHGLVPSRSWPYFHCTVVVEFNKTSQTIHDSFSASFMKVFDDDALDRAVTISLLDRQQLERVDQVFTQTLWRLARFEDLCMMASAPVCTISILLSALHLYWPPHIAHHQLPSRGKLLQCGHTYDSYPFEGPFRRVRFFLAISLSSS